MQPHSGDFSLSVSRALPCTYQGNFLEKVSLDPSKTFEKLFAKVFA
jgi:hypothetical protein